MKSVTIRPMSERRAVAVALGWLPILFVLGGTLPISAFWFLPVSVLLSINGAFATYAKGKSLTIGKKPVEIPPPEPEERLPLAFPPKPTQCYICGNYDLNRKEVFGTSAHATCEEWLGPWKPPQWSIRYQANFDLTLSGHRIYGFSALSHDGWATEEEMLEFCLKHLGHLELLEAVRGDECVSLHHLNKPKESE